MGQQKNKKNYELKIWYVKNCFAVSLKEGVYPQISLSLFSCLFLNIFRQ